MKYILTFLVALVAIAEAHVYRDHWMIKNRINPDYMHYKAMASRSKAAVVEERIKQGHFSAQEIDFS